MNIFLRFWKEIKKNTISFVGSIISIIVYVYNLFRPTNVSVPSQSIAGGALYSWSLGALAIFAFLLFASFMIWRFAKKYSGD